MARKKKAKKDKKVDSFYVEENAPKAVDITYCMSLTGVSLTDEQLNTAEAIVKGVSSKQITTLGGFAGTGKTTIVSHLIKRLPNYACCAFTGKAADVLRSKKIDATTIHSLIYDVEKENGKLIFEKKDFLPCRGIIVDEASMVGRHVYADLISYGIPIIFIGDHGQLEPVGEDLYLMKNPDFKLETVHRNAGDIAMFAQHLRAGFPATGYKSETDSVRVMSKSECRPFMLSADQIICAKNETRVNINRWVRELKGHKSESPIVGDRIISLFNSRKYGIFNGSQGVIQQLHPTKLLFEMPNGKVVVPYNVETFHQEKTCHDFKHYHPFDYAYAVTCHKAQGSEWDKVTVIEQVISAWDHKRWAYTAASRAKTELNWILPD
jgi:exodeoxyribonuclease-5